MNAREKYELQCQLYEDMEQYYSRKYCLLARQKHKHKEANLNVVLSSFVLSPVTLLPCWLTVFVMCISFCSSHFCSPSIHAFEPLNLLLFVARD